MKNEGPLYVLDPTESFDEGGESDEVRPDVPVLTELRVESIGVALHLHVLKDLSGFEHVSAADATVDYRVEGDDIWLTVWLSLLRRLDHNLVDLNGPFKVVGPAVSLDHSRVYDGVRLDTEVFIHLILREDLREDLLGLLDVTVSNAGIDQASESDVIVDDWLLGQELVAFENIEGHLHVTNLSISFYEDAHLDR